MTFSEYVEKIPTPTSIAVFSIEPLKGMAVFELNPSIIFPIIDRVLGVIRISRQEILDPPAHLSETELKFIEGVVIYEKRFISIIQSEDTLSIEAS